MGEKMSGEKKAKRAAELLAGVPAGRCAWCRDVEQWMDDPMITEEGEAIGTTATAAAEWFYWDFMCGLGRRIALGYLAVPGIPSDTSCHPDEYPTLIDEASYARELEKARVAHASHATAAGEVGLMIHPRGMTRIGVPINWVPPEEADEE